MSESINFVSHNTFGDVPERCCAVGMSTDCGEQLPEGLAEPSRPDRCATPQMLN